MNRLSQFKATHILFILSFLLLTACGGGDDAPPPDGTITGNAPIAVAGDNQTVVTASQVNLDGSASSDADGDSLTYVWVFVSIPNGSSASLSSSTSVTTSFTADLDGLYVIGLIVSDGVNFSDSSIVSVVANATGSGPLASASSEIAAALNETITTITGAVVTYIKETIGGDPAGFFVQAEQYGPAVFVRIDATIHSLSLGDIVSFEAQVFENNSGRVEITQIANMATLSSGYIPAALTQDVSNVSDLVSSLSDYSAELMGANLTITSGFGGAGSGFIAATVETSAITAEPNLKLRLPFTVNDVLGLENGCTLSILATPMWQFISVAQLSIWQADEALNVVCPEPHVVIAVATSATQVNVTFSRAIDPASITDAATQFIFDNGLSAASATASDNVIGIITGTQAEGVLYTLMVATSITDNLGNPIDNTANTATFTGYVPPSLGTGLVINEVDYDQVSTDTLEFIEIYNPTGSAISLSGINLVLVNGNGEVDYLTTDLSGAGTLAVGGYLVIGNSAVSNVDIIISNGIVQNGAPDGIRLESTAAGTIDSLAYEGTMTTAGEGGSPTVIDDNVTADLSICRLPDGVDTDDNSADFVACTSTPGTSNLAKPVPDITVTDSVPPNNDMQIPFGIVTIGSSVERTVTITNNGTSDLVVGAVANTNPLASPFNITLDTCSGVTLIPSSTCALSVRYAPTSTVTSNDSFNIPSNDPDESSVTVSVSGTGASLPAPNVSVSPTSINFGVVCYTPAMSASGDVAVQNTGTANLSITSITISGNRYSGTNNCPASLSPGSSCTVTVIFVPTSAGTMSGTLTIDSNDPPAIDVSLTGIGENCIL